MADTIGPKQAIRRFDVFAEYKKLKSLKEGHPLDEAKGYGLWVAKVVASRRFAPLGPSRPKEEREEREREAPEERPRIHVLNGQPQTADLFDREIVHRMGEDFYREVFAPTIAQHFQRGDRYEAIRDAVRKNWKPAGRLAA